MKRVGVLGLALSCVFGLFGEIEASSKSAEAELPRIPPLQIKALAQDSGPAFPRLGMWWLDPHKASVKAMARYDLLIDEFEDETLEEKLSALRKANPQIKVFRPLSPTELDLFSDTEGVPNPAVKDLPSSFFLLRVGTVLTKPVTPQDSLLHVREMKYANGAPMFHVGGEVAIGEGESAHVTGIDDKAKTLRVKRGYVRAARPHPAGESVASHVRFWPGSVVMNVASACPKVKLPHFDREMNYLDYYFSLMTGEADFLFESPEDNAYRVDQDRLSYDGFLIDRFEDRESWLKTDENENETLLDLRHDGQTVSDEAFDASWREGTDYFLKLIRQNYPGLPVIRNNPLSERNGVYDGQVYETEGWAQEDEKWWEHLMIKPDESDPYREGAYLNWFHQGLKPYVMMEAYDDESMAKADGDGEYQNPFLKKGFTPNYKRLRFSLCSALLGDGYYSYEINTNGHGALGLMWFDEYDNAGESRAYLGQPLEEAGRLSNGVYYRRFTGGLVLCNPQQNGASLSLDQAYRHIKGRQQPKINNGKRMTRVDLPPFDGLILIKNR